MKKVRRLIRLVILVLLIFGLVKGYQYLKNNDILPDFSNLFNKTDSDGTIKENKENGGNKQGGKEENPPIINDDDPIDEVNPNMNISKVEWIALFDYTNYTVKSSSIVMHEEIVAYYYCVDGKFYVKDSDGNFSNRDDDFIPTFDFTKYYSKFSYDETKKCYVAIDLVKSGEAEDSNPCDIYIYVDQGKIYRIVQEKYPSRSLCFVTEFTFNKYGETEVEE